MVILNVTAGVIIGASVLVFLLIIILLVAVLLLAKAKLLPSGKVRLFINDKEPIDVSQGNTLLSTLQGQNILLPSACGGSGACGMCRLQIPEGGGDCIPTEKGFFSRKEQMDNWHLACQVKVKNDLHIKIPESILGIKEWECEVISNKNVASFIKEFKVKLPAGEHMKFIPGSYAQIRIPEYDIDYSRDMDKSLIGDLYVPVWEKFGLFGLKQKNTESTVRAYSMANYPDEGDIITLTVRIATPPFKPKEQGPGFQNVPCGIASTYIFSLKPGDKVYMSGAYGDFHPVFDSKREMIWIGGGAGMAPMRSHIMHLFKTEKTGRKVNFFYGARSLKEAFYLEDFHGIEKDFPNFKFHLALDRPDPVADAAGVKYIPGFVHNVLFETYLKNHEAPEDIIYLMCGPPMMTQSVVNMLDNLGVPPENILYDNFGS